jgi:methyltransferase (TIGR00027 family)
MRGRASWTAELVTLFRAAGGEDPYAEQFLSTPYQVVLRAWRAGARLGLDPARASFGIVEAVWWRHRLIDEAVVFALERGATQLVLLGAGYDARPWRLAEDLVNRRVFLVDHPATGASRARRADELPPVDATVVPVDFTRDDFAQALPAAGFDPHQPCVVVWEGVSMYLPRETLSANLRRLASLMAPGSVVAMDLFQRAPRGRPARWIERAALWTLAAAGEPIHYGPDFEDLPGFFARNGLTLVRRELCGPGTHPGMVFVAAEPAPGGRA